MGDPWVQTSQQWYNTTYSTTAGFQGIAVDGVPGWQTMYALTRALQHELGLTALSDNFGTGTLTALTAYGAITVTNPDTSENTSNLVKIAQAALYCKGYNAGNGELTGIWNPLTRLAVTNLRGDLGLGLSSSDLSPKLFKFLLTMSAARLLPGGDAVVRQGQQFLNARYNHRRDFYFVPADGFFLRDTHRALLFGIQYELDMEDGVANGNFGPGTKSGLQSKAHIQVGEVDGSRAFVKLFHFSLRVNGYPVSFDSTYSIASSSQTKAFQSFVALPSTGSGDLQTWASLVVSTGDSDRLGTGADCVMTITAERLSTLRGAGYQYFGRYLTNTPKYTDLDKCIKAGELERIFASGGRVFPLFQTGGGDIEHFTSRRGQEVGEEAANAAWGYGIRDNTIIYFSVDFDALPYEVTNAVIPYFQGIHERIQRTGRTYRVGVYGPRDVCRRIVDEGLAVSSFVSDMSTGYAGNLGQPLPQSWAFDQIKTLTVGTGAGAIEIDKNIVSGSDAGIAGITSTIISTPDPLIPPARITEFEQEYFRACWEHEDSLVQQLLMPGNATGVLKRILGHDEFITQLAADWGIPKAVALTPLIWEGMVIRADDDAKDDVVFNYYLVRTDSFDPGTADDSSTGVCQIFARTAIRAHNWGVSVGLISGTPYDVANWRDKGRMWNQLHFDEEFNIKMATLNMMYEATGAGGASYTQLRNMTPSQVMAMCVGYNDSWFDGGAPGVASQVYGRNRMQLYYTIKRWLQSL